MYGTVDHSYDGTKVYIQNADGSSVCTGTTIDDAVGTQLCGCRVAQCDAGRLVADAVRFATKSDVGFYNGGGIGGSLFSLSTLPSCTSSTPSPSLFLLLQLATKSGSRPEGSIDVLHLFTFFRAARRTCLLTHEPADTRTC